MSAHLLALAATCLILFAPLGRRLWRRQRARIPAAVREALPVLALVLASAWVYAPLVKGHAPTTFDNNYGVLKTVESDDLLHRHELFGWSDFEDAGFPANVHYPFAGALLSSALHALPGVSREATQAWCVWLAMLSMVLACYLAGRLHFGMGAGLIAGALALLDPGAWWVGGHFMTVEIGMWIQTVSTALAICGLALWPRAVERGTPGSVALCSGALGLAVLFHPQAALLEAAAGVFMVPALLATRGLRARAVLLRSALVAASTLAWCAFWLVPYLANRDTSAQPSVPPVGAEWLWAHLVDGTLLRGPGLWMGVSVVGALLAARRREPFARFLSLAAPGLAVLFTQEALKLLHLRSGPDGLADHLQLSRMFYLQRPLAFLLVGCALAPALGRAVLHLGGPRGGWSAWLNRGIAAGLAVVLLHLPGVHLPGWPATPRPVGLKPQQVTDLDHALDAAQLKLRPGERLILRTGDWFNHDLLFEAAARGLKVMVIGGDAAMMFKNHFSTESPELLERVGASVMISRGALPPALAKFPSLGRFGELELRELPRLPRAWMQGPGAVDVESWGDEEVRLRVSGSGPSSRVRLGLAYFAGWRLDDGAKPSPFQLAEAMLTELPAHDGELVLRYHPPASRWPGLLLSAIGLGLLGAWALRVRAPRAVVAASAPPAAPEIATS